MAQLNTSFYPGASGSANPMGMMQGYVGIGNMLLQRQIMAGEYGMKKESFEAQKMIGEAAMSSTNPDGSIDRAAFQRRIAEMPEGIQRHAWDAIEKATQRQHTIAQTRMAEMQTEQLEREMIAKEAAGHILQATTDPKTGAFNFKAALGLMASDPAFRPYVGYMMKEFVETGKVDAETAAVEFATAKGRTEALAERLAPIAKKAASGEEIPEGDVQGLISYMYALGQIDADTALAVTKEFAALPVDQRRDAVLQFVEGTKTGLDNLRAMEGDPQYTDLGDRVQRDMITPRGVVDQGALQKGLDPATAQQPVNVGTQRTADGIQQLMVPFGELQNYSQMQQGGNQLTQGPLADMPQQENMLAPGGGYTPPVDEAALPYGPEEQMMPEEQMVPQGPALPQGGFVQPQLDPAHEEFLVGAQQQYRQELKDAGHAADEAINMLHRLDLAEKALDNFAAGKGASAWKLVADAAQFVGRDDIADALMSKHGGAKDAYAWTEVFQKLAVENTMNNLRQAIGGQGRLTNLEFEQFLKSYPNIGTDKRAIKEIFTLQRELAMLAIEQQEAASEWPAIAKEFGLGLHEFKAHWKAQLTDRRGWKGARAWSPATKKVIDAALTGSGKEWLDE
jgi:hypothetical protein